MRQGSSMLELVIAIVVMGIAVMSLPLILLQTKSNNEFALQQESILAARTKLGDILTYAWDEEATNQLEGAFVLDTNDTGSETELNKHTNSRRIGHLLADKRRKGFDTFTQATAHNALGSDTGEVTLLAYDDIDDFHNSVQSLYNTGEAALNGLDYKFTDINLTTRVIYVDDSATYSNQIINDFIFTTANANRRSNLKMIQIDVVGAQTNFSLRAYSANIGESELLRRTTW